jgi:hypothetical protein
VQPLGAPLGQVVGREHAHALHCDEVARQLGRREIDRNREAHGTELPEGGQRAHEAVSIRQQQPDDVARAHAEVS